VNIYLDGEFTFSLGAEVAVRERLRVGQELSDDRLEALASADGYHRCFDAAARYLSYRPRSEAELRQRLGQRGFAGDIIEKVLGRLKEQGLVDDASFARSWRDNRQALLPASQWLIRRELKQKGVAEAIVEQTVAAVDDSDNAYRAAVARLRSLPKDDYQVFRRRLGAYLKRRGFNYGVINHTINRVWEDQQQ
jgi:regulatory protein